jgi:hypothetical protein
MNIIEFLSKLELEQRPMSGLGAKGQILAPLACLLRATTPRVDGAFITYALKHSTPFRCLHRWICQRAQAWSNFIAIFMNDDRSDHSDEERKSSSSEGQDGNSGSGTQESGYSLSFRARDFTSYAAFKFNDDHSVGEDEEEEEEEEDEDPDESKETKSRSSRGGVSSRKMNNTVRQCMNWLESETLDDESKFYESAIVELRKNNQPLQALFLADSVLSPSVRTSKTESILGELVGNSRNDK